MIYLKEVGYRSLKMGIHIGENLKLGNITGMVDMNGVMAHTTLDSLIME